MTFSKVTADLLDSVVIQLSAETSEAEQRDEITAGAEIAVESRILGSLAKDALTYLSNAINTGEQRRVLVGGFSDAVRIGWHLRRILHERESLDGMLSEAEMARLRREIREAV